VLGIEAVGLTRTAHFCSGKGGWWGSKPKVGQVWQANGVIRRKGVELRGVSLEMGKGMYTATWKRGAGQLPESG